MGRGSRIGSASVVTLLAAACGGDRVSARSDTDGPATDDGESGEEHGSAEGSGDSQDSSDTGAEIEPGPCSVVSRHVLFEELDDGFAAAIARHTDQLGVLLWVDPATEGSRHLRFGQTSLADPTPFVGTEPLVFSGAITDVGLVPMTVGTETPPTFLGAWAVGNAARGGWSVHAGRLRDDQLLDETVVALSPSSWHVGIGRTGSGRYVVNWVGEAVGPSDWQLLAAASDDGEVFGDPTVLGVAGRPRRASYASVDDGAGVAWISQFDDPSRSALYFARLDGTGSLASVAQSLTDHQRYVYDVALVRGSTRFGIATTDSRENIIDVPLYFTSIAFDGTDPTAGARLTHQRPHEFLDMAWGGASYGLAYDEHDGENAEIWFRQLDDAGELLFEPIQISNATFVQWDCCTSAQHAHVVSHEPGHFLVVWDELWERGADDSAWGIKAAVVECLE